MHDGAVVVEKGRISRVGVFLPLTSREDLPIHYGTRHRAAIGLTEQSDAMVIVVSDERGDVSAAEGAAMSRMENASDLVRQMQAFDLRAPSLSTSTIRTRLLQLLSNLDGNQLVARVDLRGMNAGLHSVTIRAGNLNLPPGIFFERALPSEFRVRLLPRQVSDVESDLCLSFPPVADAATTYRFAAHSSATKRQQRAFGALLIR